MARKAKELSALVVSRLETPGLWFVGGVAGLALQVLNSGARTWILRVMVAGKRRDMGLGGYPDVTLAGAKEKARKARDEISEGKDPIEDRKAAKSALAASRAAALTFQQAATSYISAKSVEWKNAKHLSQWTNSLTTYAYPVIGVVLVRDVEQSHILRVLEPIWLEKTETATRVRQRIEAILDWAMARGYRPKSDNPARWRGHLDKLLASPRKVAKVEHHAALPYGEIAAFMVELRSHDGLGARALEFAILTAARSGEVRGACWSEINLDTAIWVIPGDRMKAGREHRVPLSDAVLALLNAQPRIVGCDWVFPSVRQTPLSDATLGAVIKRMGRDVTTHGFRSTFRDWGAECTSYPGEVLEMALAHTVGNAVEAAYRRGDLFEKRQKMMQDWAKYCAGK